MSKTIIKHGLTHVLPEVILLQDSGIGVAELAARTCYDSFDKSENPCIVDVPFSLDTDEINNIDESKLLYSLAWVHHHHSILEHTTASFMVKGTSRGVLQEQARHRMQNISVRSTRYTMASVIHAFVASQISKRPKYTFKKLIKTLDMFVIIDDVIVDVECGAMYAKIDHQSDNNQNFITDVLVKSSVSMVKKFKGNSRELFEALEEGSSKRNVGDAFKHIVTDNWKTDIVITFNLRSLKNYFDLRDSGAAWYQIQWLAQAMKDATPNKYMELIDKTYRSNKG